MFWIAQTQFLKPVACPTFEEAKAKAEEIAAKHSTDCHVFQSVGVVLARTEAPVVCGWLPTNPAGDAVIERHESQ